LRRLEIYFPLPPLFPLFTKPSAYEVKGLEDETPSSSFTRLDNCPPSFSPPFLFEPGEIWRRGRRTDQGIALGADALFPPFRTRPTANAKTAALWRRVRAEPVDNVFFFFFFFSPLPFFFPPLPIKRGEVGLRGQQLGFLREGGIRPVLPFLSLPFPLPPLLPWHGLDRTAASTKQGFLKKCTWQWPLLPLSFFFPSPPLPVDHVVRE